jgi:2-(1,2-epoxy-1,2-dihydrophenyl)acetyl-CoA isomerase
VAVAEDNGEAAVSADVVRFERDDGVARIILNTPRRKNAIGPDGWRRLLKVFGELDSRRDRVVVISGAGDDFCAGADLGERDPELSNLEGMWLVNQTCVALHRLPMPTIARVDGAAVGAGMNMALACDFVVASSRARFSEIFIKRGLSVDFGGSWLLPRLVGLHTAKALVLLGDLIDAETARGYGLVHRIVEPDDLDQAVADLAGRLRVNPPVAAALSKRLLNAAFESSLQEALDNEAHCQTINLGLEDAVEAFTAFQEKRMPNFKGR